MGAFSLLKLLPPILFLGEEDILTCVKGAGFEIVQHWRPHEDEALLPRTMTKSAKTVFLSFLHFFPKPAGKQ